MNTIQASHLQTVADVFFDGVVPTRENFLVSDPAPIFGKSFGW